MACARQNLGQPTLIRSTSGSVAWLRQHQNVSNTAAFNDNIARQLHEEVANRKRARLVRERRCGAEVLVNAGSCSESQLERARDTLRHPNATGLAALRR